jgi:hypothetical protein
MDVACAGNMLFLEQPVEVVSFTTALLILLFKACDDLGRQMSHLADMGNKFDNDMNDVFVE